MEAKINVKELLAQTITGTCIALQQELENDDPGYEALVMYKSLLDNIVSYTALCGYTPDGITNWSDVTCGMNVDIMRKLLNDFEVINGLAEISVDAGFLAGMLPETEHKSVSDLLATATGDKVGNNLNPPDSLGNEGWEVPKSFIQSVLPMTTQDSSGGLDHCVAILTKVYTKMWYKFAGKTYEQGQSIAAELLRTKSSELMECMLVEDNYTPTFADTVTLAECVYWTAGYITTGIAASFVLAYADFDDDDKFLLHRPAIWNCMRTTSAQGLRTYPNYGFVEGQRGKDIPILATSLDTLKVHMMEGQV